MATALPEPLSDGQAGDKGAEERFNFELRQLPDQLLQGKLQRLQQVLDSEGFTASLPDGGDKCRLMHGAARREFDRRHAASSHQPPPPRPHGRQGEPDEENCERTAQSMCAESSDIQVTSSLPAQVEVPACPSKQLPEVHVMEPKLESCQVETPACPTKQLLDVHVIEPKLEPCEESLVLVPDAAEDCEPTLLSGDHPFFTTVMSRSHVQTPFQMCIPVRFQHHLPKACTAATLICGGKSWAVSYRGDLKSKKLDTAWMGFVVDNRLQIDDACVFEMVRGDGGGEEVVFQVQILRGGLPEDFTSRGATADEPIVILD